MPYSIADVVNQNLLDKCTSLADIEALVSQMSGQVLDSNGRISTAQRLLYSGNINGQKVWESVNALVANAPDKYTSVGQSQVGEFLNSNAFIQKLSSITGFGPDSTELANLLTGSADSPTGKYGFWGNASEAYVLEPTNNNFRSDRKSVV
jgi:hypothetical protein